MRDAYVPICVRTYVVRDDDCVRVLDDNVSRTFQLGRLPTIFNLLVESLSRRRHYREAGLTSTIDDRRRDRIDRWTRHAEDPRRKMKRHGDFPTSRAKDLFSSASLLFSSPLLSPLCTLCRGAARRRVVAACRSFCVVHVAPREPIAPRFATYLFSSLRGGT